jgi:hypothetical protein
MPKRGVFGKGLLVFVDGAAFVFQVIGHGA